MEGYKFSELLKLVIEIKLYDTAYRDKKGKCQCTFKSKRQGMDCYMGRFKWSPAKASTKSDMSKKWF